LTSQYDSTSLGQYQEKGGSVDNLTRAELLRKELGEWAGWKLDEGFTEHRLNWREPKLDGKHFGDFADWKPDLNIKCWHGFANFPGLFNIIREQNLWEVFEKNLIELVSPNSPIAATPKQLTEALKKAIS